MTRIFDETDYLDSLRRSPKAVTIPKMELTPHTLFGIQIHKPHKRKGDWMQTYTGVQFWPLDPRMEDVCIEDIAHSLSMQCRYAGHCIRFYSVAEHCVHLAMWAYQNGHAKEVALQMLMHDASEAYLVDMPKPVKCSVVGYDEMEVRVMNVICAKFNLPYKFDEIVKFADRQILHNEKKNMSHPPADWNIGGVGLDGVEIQNWTPEIAEEKFIAAFQLFS